MRFALVAMLSLLVASGEAWACAVCMSGQEDPSANAFLLSTIILSLVPLGMIGGAVYYIVRRTRAVEALDEPSVPTP